MLTFPYRILTTTLQYSMILIPMELLFCMQFHSNRVKKDDIFNEIDIDVSDDEDETVPENFKSFQIGFQMQSSKGSNAFNSKSRVDFSIHE